MHNLEVSPRTLARPLLKLSQRYNPFLFFNNHVIVILSRPNNFSFLSVHDNGGPSETVLDGITGYRMKHPDPQTLANQIEAVVVVTSVTGNNPQILDLCAEEKADLLKLKKDKHMTSFTYATFVSNVKEMVKGLCV